MKQFVNIPASPATQFDRRNAKMQIETTGENFMKYMIKNCKY